MKNTIEMQAVVSSQIEAIGHNDVTNTLAIQFPTKAATPNIYHYKNVTRQIFDAFKSATSIGSFFIQNIKKNPELYPYIKLS